MPKVRHRPGSIEPQDGVSPVRAGLTAGSVAAIAAVLVNLPLEAPTDTYFNSAPVMAGVTGRRPGRRRALESAGRSRTPSGYPPRFDGTGFRPRCRHGRGGRNADGALDLLHSAAGGNRFRADGGLDPAAPARQGITAPVGDSPDSAPGNRPRNCIGRPGRPGEWPAGASPKDHILCYPRLRPSTLNWHLSR